MVERSHSCSAVLNLPIDISSQISISNSAIHFVSRYMNVVIPTHEQLKSFLFLVNMKVINEKNL